MIDKVLGLVFIAVALTTNGAAEPSGGDNIFESNELGISFAVPEEVSGCEEDVYDFNADPNTIGDFVPGGFQTKISCDGFDLYIEAYSMDYNCYEKCTLFRTYPSKEEIKQFLSPEGKAYDYGEFTVVVDASYWGLGGEHFFIGTYYPLGGDKYDTMRVSMKIGDVTKALVVEQGDIIDMDGYRAFVDEYSNKIVDRTADTLKIVEAFEKLLGSIY